jgi:hypothetical protein
LCYEADDGATRLVVRRSNKMLLCPAAATAFGDRTDSATERAESAIVEWV